MLKLVYVNNMQSLKISVMNKIVNSKWIKPTFFSENNFYDRKDSSLTKKYGIKSKWAVSYIRLNSEKFLTFSFNKKCWLFCKDAMQNSVNLIFF